MRRSADVVATGSDLPEIEQPNDVPRAPSRPFALIRFQACPAATPGVLPRPSQRT